MKRLPLSLSIISLLLFPILSCEQEKVANEEENKQEQETEKEPEENDDKSLTVTAEAFNITIVSAELSGYANLTSTSGNVKIGILYSTDENPTADNGVELIAQELDSKNKYTVTATGLYPETTYYYCSFVIQGGIRFKGSVKSFTTKGLGVNLRIGGVSNLTCYSAKVSGNISFDEGVKYTNYTYGICYDTIQEPTVDDKKIQAVSKDSEGNYTCQLRALSGSTKYYFRLYATVDSFIKYSVIDSLLTVADSSVITTGDVDLTTYEIKSKFEIGNGVYNNLLLGVCYGINEVPTVDDRTVTTNEVDDASNFVVILKQLSSQIPYYYRAYVIIDSIPHYGVIKTFTKEKQIGEAVDLGLSVMWGSFNVGADYPEDYGDYYAWGETEPKTNYDWPTYKYSNGSAYSLTKYCVNVSNGNVDSKTTLDIDDDVAYVKWGGNWRMPTKEEFQELSDNCTWEWTTINDVYGYKVTSNKSGFTGNSIFLPAAGYHHKSGYYNSGSNGYYNSSSLNTSNNENQHEFLISNGVHKISAGGCREHGHSVRPVSLSETWLNNLSLTLNKESISLIVEREQTLSANVSNGGENVDYLVKDKIAWSSDNPSVASIDGNGNVTALSVGSANIKVTCYDKSATCIVTVTEPVYEYVDLGLSVNWATFNVGAMIPEEYGNYYSWGEIMPKSNYNWSTYKYSNGASNSLTKYCSNSSYGSVDGKTVLDLEDDVAFVKWGGNWRIPTIEEATELISNCTWSSTIQNGVYGYLVYSKIDGYTDKSIFLPAAGGYHHDNGLQGRNICGYYWVNSNSINPIYANGFSFDSRNGSFETNSNDAIRVDGRSVRPVCKSDTWYNNLSISINQESASIEINESKTLSAIIKNGNEDVTYILKNQLGWSSDKPSVATVDKNGIIKGISEGTAEISVSYNDMTATCQVTVTKVEGEWVYVNSNFNKYVSFTKIRVLNQKSTSDFNCCIDLTTTAGEESSPYYFINMYTQYICVTPNGHYSGTKISDCEPVEGADGWYEYVFEEPVFLLRYQKNAPSNQLMAYVPKNSNKYDFVDLGLSVNWATCNIGATIPEEYGDYYAWGETETKSNYSASTYKFRTSGNSDTNLKCSKYNVLESGGVIDNKVLLEPEDDVAHVIWGGNWRMPTKVEQEELVNNCTSEWITVNGVKGILFTSKIEGYTDKSIFLPAAGYYSSSIRGHESGKRLLYWSSILDTSKNGHCYYINSDPQQNISLEVVGGIRYYGKSIRPVCP